LPGSAKKGHGRKHTENTEGIFFRVLRVSFSVAFPFCGFAAPGQKLFYWISCGGSAESTERLFVPISEKETIGFVEVS